MLTRRTLLSWMGQAVAVGAITAMPLLSVDALAQSKGKAKAKGITTVYVTRTGTKYHRETCRHLARSKIPMSLTEAAKRYGPCGTCRPPTP